MSWGRCRLLLPAPLTCTERETAVGLGLAFVCGQFIRTARPPPTRPSTFSTPGSGPGTGLWEGQVHTSPDMAGLLFLVGSWPHQPGLWGQRPKGGAGIRVSVGREAGATCGPGCGHVAGRPWSSSRVPFAWAEGPRTSPLEAGGPHGSFRQVRLGGRVRLWGPWAVERRLDCIPGRRGFKQGAHGLVYV